LLNFLLKFFLILTGIYPKFKRTSLFTTEYAFSQQYVLTQVSYD